MFDKPRLALMIAYIAFPPLAAWALIKWVGVDALGYICMFFVGFGSWYVVGMQVAAELADYKRVNARDGVRPSIVPQPVAEVKPRIFADGKLVNAFDTPKLKIDARRHMAIQQWRTLEYHDGDAGKLNWTEDYWLGGGWIDKKKKELGKHTRKWKGKNDEFRQTMHDWDGAVIQKKDPLRDNSEYVLRSEAELKRKADGR